jgi:hypothetical protein
MQADKNAATDYFVRLFIVSSSPEYAEQIRSSLHRIGCPTLWRQDFYAFWCDESRISADHCIAASPRSVYTKWTTVPAVYWFTHLLRYKWENHFRDHSVGFCVILPSFYSQTHEAISTRLRLKSVLNRCTWSAESTPASRCHLLTLHCTAHWHSGVTRDFIVSLALAHNPIE